MSSSPMASKEELEIEMKDCDQHAGWLFQQLQMKAGFGGQTGKRGNFSSLHMGSKPTWVKLNKHCYRKQIQHPLLPLCWTFFVVALWGISSRSPPLTFTLLCGIMTGIIRQNHGTARFRQKGDSWTSHQRGPHNRRQTSAQYWPQEVQMTQCHVCGNYTKKVKENYLMQKKNFGHWSLYATRGRL